MGSDLPKVSSVSYVIVKRDNEMEQENSAGGRKPEFRGNMTTTMKQRTTKKDAVKDEKKDRKDKAIVMEMYG